ncbi:hypothetical protein Ae201684P_015924 [Aphanomyces euteiches]|uniref:Uncharacterized protein n=1 Tax=Aphanomyces euteiches TaxID=100861 RepID=A0A6G0WCV5_9STRA|nr:hypothetical protein Ae201684_017143 [Aphanomyces euteiches]KAH9074026.1 hypothetical protein Ae201684P_015924 [Aphanomyces euteiches]
MRSICVQYHADHSLQNKLIGGNTHSKSNLTLEFTPIVPRLSVKWNSAIEKLQNSTAAAPLYRDKSDLQGIHNSSAWKSRTHYTGNSQISLPCRQLASQNNIWGITSARQRQRHRY